MKQQRPLYILCGGQSARMGRDKSDLIFKGKPFLDHLLDRTVPFYNDVILLGANREFKPTIKQIPDAMDDSGPLGGLLAALQHSKNETIAILPVDLPLISEQTIRYLNDAALDNMDAIVAKSIDRIQPLAGIYQNRISSKLESYLTSDNRSVMGFLKEIRFRTFEVTREEIMNINTPEQYEELLKKYS